MIKIENKYLKQADDCHTPPAHHIWLCGMKIGFSGILNRSRHAYTNTPILILMKAISTT
ncbi:hypothetical protein RG47T_4888 [Mucilaginibacter polytrichastri]|uniref:Uncharacterized protein n=2 Tax=Mucilaginibacter polytrichastri TaxID=1302689 RepID=A0A1Q6A5X1_9SPHI|nr:hypothetical protein RG47T_4888 [Mucilaginibacter polytrichastri]